MSMAAAQHVTQSGSNGDLAIDLAEVAKTYRGRVRALRGISMRVHRGEVFGLLGPNGAGKSTLVKILMTVIRPTRCRGTMLGRPVGEKGVLGRVGYLPEHHKFPEYLTGWQVLDYYGALADVPRRERRERGEALLDLVGLSEWRQKKVKGYSKGMRQRLGVAQALINDPDLVLLDEPTDGVDPVGRRDIREILVRLREQGKTVLVNSHLLSELEMVCDRVAILVQGVVSAQGTIHELTTYGRRYEIEVAENGDGSAMREALVRPGLVQGLEMTGSLEDLAQPMPAGGMAAGVKPGRPLMRGTMAGGLGVEVDGSVIRIATDETAVVQPIIDSLRARGLAIRSVRPVRPTLEDLFMKAVTDPTTGQVLNVGAQRPGRRPTP